MPFCTNCGVKISGEAVFCPECGQKVDLPEPEFIGQTRVCRRCGASSPADMVYCLNCGMLFDPGLDRTTMNQALSYSQIYSQPGIWKNKWVTLLLCIFFGYLGVHRFYEGKIRTGILYLCTLGLFGIGVLVDLFIIATYPNPYRVK